MPKLNFIFGLAAAIFVAASAVPAAAAARAGETDMLYVGDVPRPNSDLDDVEYGDIDRGFWRHPLLGDMRAAAIRFEREWGELPQITLPTGRMIRPGQSDSRIPALRIRLGIAPGTRFDRELASRISDYRAAHDLPRGRHVDNTLIASLNKGHAHYRGIIEANLERAAELPEDPGERYIIVDAAEQRLYMFEDGRQAKSMKVIVGKTSDPTPMMAGMISYSVLNPYWNVPPDLVARNIAPRVLEEGKAYLDRTGFEALSGWTIDARVLDYEEVDWQAVADGEIELRVRQRPGPGNGMGEIKFMFPNELGIYLHDTPSRALFDENNRAFSAGCVRLEDAWELAKWLYGERPSTGDGEPEQRVDLAEPVPVYITYLTAVPSNDGFVFRDDFYGRDKAYLARR